MQELSAAGAALRRIEVRIATHFQHAADELLGVGLCLIEAKERELVPHGQWEEWVRQHTGMSERTAQRLMATAREVPEGSVLATLPISQVQAILALPEPEREDMAQQAKDDGLSVRKLQEAIEAKQEAERRANGLQQAIDTRDAHYDRAQAELAKKLKAAEALAAAEAEDRRNADQRANDRWRLTIQNLRDDLEEARKTAPAEGITLEAQANIDRLAGQLAAAQRAMKEQEARLMEQAEKRQEAQNALMALRRQVARGDMAGEPTEGLTLEGLAEATRSFLGKVGTVPHMGRTLATLRQESRDGWEQYIDMVSAWVEGAREAMKAVEGVVDLDQ